MGKQLILILLFIYVLISRSNCFRNGIYSALQSIGAKSYNAAQLTAVAQLTRGANVWNFFFVHTKTRHVKYLWLIFNLDLTFDAVKLDLSL